MTQSFGDSEAELAGKAVLITGGAGHLGRAAAMDFACRGAAGFIVDRDETAVGNVVTEIAERTAVTWEPVVSDLENETERLMLADKVSNSGHHIDILVNCAAFVGDSSLEGWVSDFAAQSLETWRRAIEVNLTAPFHLSQLFAGDLARNGEGAIINVGSIYGVVGPDLSVYEGTPMGNPAAYAASKGGLVQLTRWLSTVLAPDIRVNCISPGGLARGQDQRFVDRYVKRTPLQRMGHVEDVIGAISFLANDRARWITGQNLVVDGGYTAW